MFVRVQKGGWPTMTREEALIEALAALAHQQWSGWMEYLFSKGCGMPDGGFCLPSAVVRRWQRQMVTAYSDLPEEEKESDRQEARKIPPLLLLAGIDL